MTDPAVHLCHWGLDDAPATLIAARENSVWRVDALNGTFALRVRRPGLRTMPEIASELAWMAMLAEGGMRLPRPVPTPEGAFCVGTGGRVADLLTWCEGVPMGRDGRLSAFADTPGRFRQLGEHTARMHALCDRWTPPGGFLRPAWDADGLVGKAPVWGRFWENPLLTAGQRDLLRRGRDRARGGLARLDGSLDYGLIHADLVPENVMLTDDDMAMIDFDDGGFGFRPFELATVVNRADRDDPGGTNAAAFLDGYLSLRPTDLSVLPLFRALRSFTYVGWIAGRMDEPQADARAGRFIDAALRHATALLETAPA